MPETRLDTARIRVARRVINPVFLDTPLYRCETLEPGLGCAVSINLETANPVRCFKARSTEVVVSQLADNGSLAALKNWRLLRKLRCSTTRITDLVKAVLTLQLPASA